MKMQKKAIANSPYGKPSMVTQFQQRVHADAPAFAQAAQADGPPFLAAAALRAFSCASMPRSVLRWSSSRVSGRSSSSSSQPPPRLADELWTVLLEAPPSATEASAWTRSLLDALQVLHARDVVHRDLSPWNVFIKDRKLLLGDFGLAVRAPAGHQLKGMVQDGCPALDDAALGSPLSAPELGAAEGYSLAVDVFSAGLTLFAIWAVCRGAAEDTAPHQEVVVARLDRHAPARHRHAVHRRLPVQRVALVLVERRRAGPARAWQLGQRDCIYTSPPCRSSTWGGVGL